MTRVVLLKSHLGAMGGLEKYARRLACAFAEKGCKTTILTTTSKKNPLPQLHSEVDILSLGSKKSLSFRNLIAFDKQCKQWLDDHPTDIIFGLDRNREQTHYRAGNGVHAAFLDQRRLIDPFFKRLSFKLNPLHRITLAYERAAFENPRLRVLFTNSHEVKKQILTYYTTPIEKIHVVHNGVEWDEMQRPFEEWPEKAEIVKTELGLNKEAFQLLFIGHGYHRKGLTHLLNGLAQLKNSNIQLSVVGKDKSLESFKSLTSQLGLSKQVFFFGPRRDIYSFYQMADALIIPSLYDPFANVTVEALAMGLFVISSAFNGGKEVLTSDSGTVIENLFNPEDVAKALQIALNHPKTTASAQKIRGSVKHLNFCNQLDSIVNTTLST